MSKAFFYYTIGQTLAWFASNAQFVWKWPRQNSITLALLVSIPITVCFTLGTKEVYTVTGSAWSARLMSFGLSYISFPILTYIFLKESIFEPKIFISNLLALMLIMIQIFWKTN